MQEARGNLWDQLRPDHALVITTNGYIKTNGQAVMGRGIALEATKRDPNVASTLGWNITYFGNHVALIHSARDITDSDWIAYPVKRRWMDDALPELIVRSAHELVTFVDERQYQHIWMPRPGCGNGHLNWLNVKPLIEDILDDRFTVMTF